MGERGVMKRAEELVKLAMKGNDASHDASHVFRVRDLALSLAHEEGLSSSPEAMEIVELAALLHDIGDYKYVRCALSLFELLLFVYSYLIARI
ncbi:hypothetical protein GIB67_036042 [Kingdonia uniflora]|uniref:HD domain-containing protein n=1 Tax=Kingdonia uniflora TaxID=39325 RepID=A0A7J7N0W9_9MAGN|nr:hypothetical protein GIB67_036042 [Kingdonia uniflora]